MPTPSEQQFIGKMVSEGWEVHQNGFPDFLCIKDGEVIVVEVKSSRYQKLEEHQYEVIKLLCSRKVKGFAWSPDLPEMLPFNYYQTSHFDWDTKSYTKGAKYDSNTKRERNNTIVSIRQSKPDMPLREIAEIFNISVARVSAIIQKANSKK